MPPLRRARQRRRGTTELDVPPFCRLDASGLGPLDPAAVFEVYRGDLQLIRDQGAYLQDPLLVGTAMRWCDLSQPQLIDGTLPDPEQTLFYLAGARNWGAVTLGFASSLIERIDDPA